LAGKGGDQEEESDEMEWYRRMTLRKRGMMEVNGPMECDREEEQRG